jgi:hypothetical protein
MFEIGNSLREARVRQGLDYPQIELATKIRAKYVRALEDEQFALMPAHPYVKGFLRTYAEFLGLDGQLYVDEFNSRFVSDGMHDDHAVPRRMSPRVHQHRGIERRVLLLGLVGIAALTALVFVAAKYGGGSPSTPSILTGKTPAATHGLELAGVGKGTYIEVRRDKAAGTVLLQATLAKGRIERVDGSLFWLFVRRPAGVHVSLGGKAVALPAGHNLKVVVTPSSTKRAGT